MNASMSESLDAIRASIERGEADEALARTVDVLAAGTPVPADVLAGVLPHAPDLVTFLHLVGAGGGAAAATALELVERERFPAVVPGPDLAAAALWVAWRRLERAAIRSRMIRLARRHLNRSLDAAALGLLADLCRQLDDAHVTKLAASVQEYATGSLIADAVKALDAPVTALADRVKAGAAERVLARGYTVRSGPRPGRNEPCPCGSGKKYKKCCAEKDDASTAAPSPVAGMSWDEYLAAGAPGISGDEVEHLAIRDLVRIDLTRAEVDTVARIERQLVAYRRWDLAGRAIDALEARGDEHADDLRAELVGDALYLGEREIARAQSARVRDPDGIRAADRLQLALIEHGSGRAAGADPLAQIEEAALAAVRASAAAAATDVAYGLLHTSPALGILVARGCLAADAALDAQTMLDAIEDARDELALAPGDPGWDVWDALFQADQDAVRADDHERTRLAREKRQLGAALETAQTRAKELEARLADLRTELAAPAAPAKAQAPSEAALADEPARRALRDRIATLEALIREGNEERAELRRALSDGGAPPAARRARAADADREPRDDDAGDGIAIPDEPDRGVLIPTFSRGAEEALRAMPAHVAAEAMRTIGQLIAGEPAAWSRVKQARDLRPPLLMARVGIHHRLLFRADGGRAEIIDVVTRESLMHTLKRLRR